ncbi:GLUG motif-containing protein [Pedobacter glucosidilyticus]|uniref:GLUG motif-containing protein n=1 Tax=Pedobacter glucosidilyticus TaxID=1122941 RepID=UPI0003FDC906|nr:GLUG motif-containing protein [Pedobacter glucosidilyticus]
MKRLIHFKLSAKLFIVASILLTALTQKVKAQYAGGTGSMGDPYQITTWEQLSNVRLNLSANYILINSLDENSADYATYASSTANTNTGWLPIGDATTKFTGNFNGNNRTISGININRPNTDYQGLFGFANGSSISNLGLLAVSITGRGLVGGLAGRLGDGISTAIGTVNDVYVTGTVTGNAASTSSTGGLIGISSNNNIDGCYSTANVTGVNRIGGLIGETSVLTVGTAGFIRNSYTTGTVIGSGERIGGLVGFANINTNISNCYANGAISGQFSVGGLLGQAISVTLSDCSASGATTASGSVADGSGAASCGGLIGDVSGTSTITKSKATGNVTGSGRNCGGLIGNLLGSPTISLCFATGSATLTATTQGSLGGFVGAINPDVIGSIQNCYAKGNVTAPSNNGTNIGVAGFVGRIRGSVLNSNFSFINCYSTGSVAGGAVTANRGGFSTYNFAVITNCFWDTQTSGLITSAMGTGTGKTTAEMKTQLTYTSASWDFTGETANGSNDYWTIDNSLNNGYPSFSYTTLPIVLKSFTAKALSNMVELRWITLSENNNKEFIIKHSTDAKNFIEIGKINASEFSNQINNYSFIHDKPAPGNNYYELIQVDNDGSIENLGYKVISFDLEKEEITTYPNPTNEYLTISFQESMFNQLILYDFSGRILQRIELRPNDNVKIVDMREYSSGYYNISLSGKNGLVSKKIIKL